MRTMGLVWMLTGCATGATDTKTPSTTGSTGSTAETGTSPTDPGPVARLEGIVQVDGAPLAKADVRLCRGVCRFSVSDATGRYEFPDLPGNTYSLEVVPAPGSGQATYFTVVDLVVDETRTIDLPILPYDVVVPLSASSQQYTLGTGLYATFAEDDIQSVEKLASPIEEVGGVRVPEANWPPLDGLTGTALGVWYIDPFNWESVDPGGLPAYFDNTWALPAGTELDVFVGSYSDYTWIDAGTATVSKDGSVIDFSLPLLSTVVLLQP